MRDFSPGLVQKFIGEKLIAGTVTDCVDFVIYPDKLEAAGGAEVISAAGGTIKVLSNFNNEAGDYVWLAVVDNKVRYKIGAGAWTDTNIIDLDPAIAYNFTFYSNPFGQFVFISGDRLAVCELELPAFWLTLTSSSEYTSDIYKSGVFTTLEGRLWARGTGDDDKVVYVGSDDAQVIIDSRGILSLFKNSRKYSQWTQLSPSGGTSFGLNSSNPFITDGLILVPRESFAISNIQWSGGKALISCNHGGAILQDDYFLVDDVVGFSNISTSSPEHGTDNINNTALQQTTTSSSQLYTDFVFDAAYSAYSSGGTVYRCDQYYYDSSGKVFSDKAKTLQVGTVNPLTGAISFTATTGPLTISNSGNITVTTTGSSNTWIASSFSLPTGFTYSNVNVVFRSIQNRNTSTEEGGLKINGTQVFYGQMSVASGDASHTFTNSLSGINITGFASNGGTINFETYSEVSSNGFELYITYSRSRVAKVSTKYNYFPLTGNNNIADLSTGLGVGDGYFEEYLAGGDRLIALIPDDNRMVVVKQNAIYRAYMDADGLYNNELVQGNVSVVSPKAILNSQLGLIFLDNRTGRTILTRLERNVTGDYLTPIDLAPQIDLEAFTIDETTTLSFVAGYLAIGCLLNSNRVTILLDVSAQRASVVTLDSSIIAQVDGDTYSALGSNVVKLLKGPGGAARAEFSVQDLDTDEQKRFRRLKYRGVLANGDTITFKARFDDGSEQLLATFTGDATKDQPQTNTHKVNERGDRLISSYNDAQTYYMVNRNVRVRTPKFQRVTFIAECPSYCSIYDFEPDNLVTFGRGNRTSRSNRS